MLYLETATQPMQVFSVLELDPATIPGGYSYGRFRDEFSARVRAIPAFREKLSDRFLNLDHPVWVEDSDFAIDRLLRSTRSSQRRARRLPAAFAVRLVRR